MREVGGESRSGCGGVMRDAVGGGGGMGDDVGVGGVMGDAVGGWGGMGVDVGVGE